MYRSSPLRSTFNTNVFTGSGMCKVCTGTRGKGVVTGSPTYIFIEALCDVKLKRIPRSQGSGTQQRFRWFGSCEGTGDDDLDGW